MGLGDRNMKAPIKNGVVPATAVAINENNYEKQFQDTLQMMKDYTATMTKSVKKLDYDVRKTVKEQKDLNQKYTKSLELYSEHYLDCSKRNLEESGDYKKVLDQCMQVNDRVSKTELKLNVVKEVVGLSLDVNNYSSRLQQMKSPSFNSLSKRIQENENENLEIKQKINSIESIIDKRVNEIINDKINERIEEKLSAYGFIKSSDLSSKVDEQIKNYQFATVHNLEARCGAIVDVDKALTAVEELQKLILNLMYNQETREFKLVERNDFNQLHSDYLKSAVENEKYKLKVDQYKEEIDKYKEEIDKYKNEINSYKKDIENYKKRTDEYISKTEIYKLENNKFKEENEKNIKEFEIFKKDFEKSQNIEIFKKIISRSKKHFKQVDIPIEPLDDNDMNGSNDNATISSNGKSSNNNIKSGTKDQLKRVPLKETNINIKKQANGQSSSSLNEVNNNIGSSAGDDISPPSSSSGNDGVYPFTDSKAQAKLRYQKTYEDIQRYMPKLHLTLSEDELKRCDQPRNPFITYHYVQPINLDSSIDDKLDNIEQLQLQLLLNSVSFEDWPEELYSFTKEYFNEIEKVPVDLELNLWGRSIVFIFSQHDIPTEVTERCYPLYNKIPAPYISTREWACLLNRSFSRYVCDPKDLIYLKYHLNRYLRAASLKYDQREFDAIDSYDVLSQFLIMEVKEDCIIW